jgi:hypothetical protein
MTSPDGRNWTLRTAAANTNWTALYWAAELGLLVAVSGSGRGDQLAVGLGRGLESAHQPVGQQRLLQVAELGQGTDHQPLGHPHAGATGERLVHHQQGAGLQAAPELPHPVGLGLVLESGGRIQLLLEQGDGLG